MLYDDFTAIRQEIFEAVKEVGLIESGTLSITNLQWLKRLPQEYDRVYNVDVSPIFNTIDMQGCVSTRKRKSDVPIEGLNPNEVGKVLVSPLQFIEAEITPNIADRIIHEGTVYSVSRISRLGCSYTGGVNSEYIADSSFLYAIMLKEASFAAQTTEYQDEQEPNFTMDADVAEENANVSGVNDDIFENVVASLKGTKVGDWEIVDDLNNLIKVSVGTYENAVITLATGTYATVAMVSQINAQISTVMGTLNLTAFTRDDKVGLETVATGTTASFELVYVTANPYSDFGWVMGVYLGKHQLVLEDSLYYSDGDPLYDTG